MRAFSGHSVQPGELEPDRRMYKSQSILCMALTVNDFDQPTVIGRPDPPSMQTYGGGGR